MTSTLSYDAEPPSCEATAFDASPGWTTEQRTHPAVMHRGIGLAPSLGHPGPERALTHGQSVIRAIWPPACFSIDANLLSPSAYARSEVRQLSYFDPHHRTTHVCRGRAHSATAS